MSCSHLNKNKALSSNRGDAEQLMEAFVESGSYKRLKELEKEGRTLRDRVRGCLSSGESRRYEIGSHLVAKFIPKKIYQYDYPGLNEYLYNLGLLQKLTILTSRNLNKDQKLLDLFEPYHLTPEYYVKPSFNRAGQELIKGERTPEVHVTLHDAAIRISQNRSQLKAVKAEYEKLKDELAQSNQLSVNKIVTYKYGSLSLRRKPLRYRIMHRTNQRIIHALIEFGKPSFDGIDHYLYKGIIKKSEFEAFRTLKDVRLDFVILDLDDEAKMQNYFHRKWTNHLLFLNE
ncbi:hypothetical protein NBRC111894_1185 [Sporolactobacillus inulinus]|uniref:Uncharacterized protein n=2 Tax=Sporolactobacillus inulinus TaxID=2078 RepID=A0A4Y1Z9Q0_9BACL|nr:hypothetical protein [Sporolactobacillus inulinus]GAY75631.1 hypothetical protein NBRC111894_1185 [Sporolactobacillus inulinus]